jgi:hypothetical protein
MSKELLKKDTIKGSEETAKELKARAEGGASLADFTIEELDILAEHFPDVEDKLYGESIVAALNDPNNHNISN